MKPRAILVLIRRPVQEHDFALVPALIRFPDVRQVEGRRTELRVGSYSGHPALVPFSAVRRIILVPDVDGDLLTLFRNDCVLRGWRGRKRLKFSSRKGFAIFKRLLLGGYTGIEYKYWYAIWNDINEGHKLGCNIHNIFHSREQTTTVIPVITVCNSFVNNW